MSATLRVSAVLGIVLLVGCGEKSASDSKVRTAPPSADATKDTVKGDDFSFDQAAEDKLDTLVLNDAAAGLSVVTLYFSAGSATNCADWTVSVTSPAAPDDLVIADSAGLDTSLQHLLVKKASGDLEGQFRTQGAKGGVRILAQGGSQLQISGKEVLCPSSESDFSVSLPVGQSDLQSIMSGSGPSISLKVRMTAPRSVGTATGSGTATATATATATETATETTTDTGTGTATP